MSVAIMLNSSKFKLFLENKFEAPMTRAEMKSFLIYRGYNKTDR
jgi:hypothetical protein